jgi:thiol-disulfide isomerase/thioredoxin
MKKIMLALALLVSTSVFAVTEVTVKNSKELSVKNLKSDRLVLMDVYMDGCKPCMILEPMLEAAEKKLGSQVLFYRLNINLIPESGIKAVPSILFMKHNKVVAGPLEGAPPSQEVLERVINEVLASVK